MPNDPCECGTTCGTGTWTGPKPGDPDNIATIRAYAVFGGIEVSWTYPGTNSHAVAHTKLYRGSTAVFAQASELAIVDGNRYKDEIEGVHTYYYWIRFISVNGTLGDPIGPASATTSAMSDDIMAQLTGRIDSGVLANALRQDIEMIGLTYDDLLAEVAARVAGNEALSALIADLQAGVEESISFVHQEIIERQNGQNALASQLDTLFAANSSNASAILTERTARVSADAAMAQDIVSLKSSTHQNTASITNEATARVSADAAMAQDIVSLKSSTHQNTASITNEATTRATADSALSSQINTIQSTLGSDIASVRVTASTNANKIGELGALWHAKVSVNGLVGGFGVYNDGREVQAGFDVDTFWVGRTQANKKKPFIIQGGQVYIDSTTIGTASIKNAHIQNLTIGTEKVANNAITVPSGASGYLSGDVTTLNIGAITSLINVEAGRLILVWGMCEYGTFGSIMPGAYMPPETMFIEYSYGTSGSWSTLITTPRSIVITGQGDGFSSSAALNTGVAVATMYSGQSGNISFRIRSKGNGRTHLIAMQVKK